MNDFNIEELTEEELKAYNNLIDENTPDLWSRISEGFDIEISQQQQAIPMPVVKKKRKFPYAYISLAAAALLITIIAIPLINNDRKKDSGKSDSNVEYESDSMSEICGEDAALPDNAGDELAEAPSYVQTGDSAYESVPEESENYAEDTSTNAEASSTTETTATTVEEEKWENDNSFSHFIKQILEYFLQIFS